MGSLLRASDSPPIQLLENKASPVKPSSSRVGILGEQNGGRDIRAHTHTLWNGHSKHRCNNLFVVISKTSPQHIGTHKLLLSHGTQSWHALSLEVIRADVLFTGKTLHGRHVGRLHRWSGRAQRRQKCLKFPHGGDLAFAKRVDLLKVVESLGREL